jgi:hypothetical protein
MVDSVCVAIWSRERVSKLANLSVIETVILPSSAKPYLGAKVQSFREYQPKRESYRFLTRRRSPEVQYPRSQKRALLTITPFCRRTVSGKGLAEGARFELTLRSPSWIGGSANAQGPDETSLYSSFKQHSALPTISISSSAASSVACLGLSEIIFTRGGRAARNSCKRRIITFSDESRMA